MRLFSWIFLVVLFPFSADGLQFRNFDAPVHQLFAEGSFPDVPELNRDLWAWPRNFSGVGWSGSDTRKNFALISPRHFVGANHFRPAIGSAIYFRSLDGTVRSYTYQRFYRIKNEQNEDTDIFIGELSEPIPAADEIPFYPVFGGSEAELAGREIYVYGWGTDGPRVGRGVVGGFSGSFLPGSGLKDTRNYSFEFRSWSGGEEDVYGEIGDSGSPSFVLVDGMPAVAGIHSAIAVQQLPGLGTRVYTFDSSVSAYVDQIEAHVASGGQRLLVSPVVTTRFEARMIEVEGNQATLSMINPAGFPYDVERTTDPAGKIWEPVAAAQTTAEEWSVPVSENEDRIFWRFRRYPVPVDYPE